MGGVIFLFGTIFGSFYNAVIYRVPRDLSVTKGRSMCPYCGTALKPLDLAPVLSMLLLRGKCRYCKAKISLRYPCVEIATGALFSLSYYLNGFSLACLFYITFWSMLIIIALIDYDHMIISDGVLLFFSLLACIHIFISGAEIKVHLLGAAVGFGLYYIIYFLSKLIYKEEAFGLGDVYLMGAVGLYSSVSKSILIVFMSFFVALFGLIAMKLFGKRLEMRQSLPFGPYMCVAAFIASLFGDYMIQAYLAGL